ncbi:hypothetical protein Ancab_005874 [Ancistrocladus abbreviatus]
MAETMEDPAFWLPSHFLTDDDFLMEKNVGVRDSVNPGGGGGGGGLRQNSLYLSMFGESSALDSPVESVVSSSETEADQDEFLAELSRQLAQSSLHESFKLSPSRSFARDAPEKPWVLGTSPQSTLTGFGNWCNRSGNGSPNGPSQVPSPPTTPSEVTERDPWELIYAAAGQVARMKLNAQQAQINHQARGLLGAPTPINPSPVPKNPNINALYSSQALPYSILQSNQFQHEARQQASNTLWGRQGREGRNCQSQQQQMQGRGRCSGGGCGGGCGGGSGGGALRLPQSACPPLRVQHHHHHQCQLHQQGGDWPSMKAVLLGGSASGGIKRQSAGTGVFLPRRHGTPTPPEPRKKTSCPTVLLPARVVQALNLNLEEMNAHHPQPVFAPDHDFLVARRNAMWARQRRSMRPEGTINHEIRLPQEWTY